MQHLSRRSFVLGMAAGVVTMACAPAAPSAPTAAPSKPADAPKPAAPAATSAPAQAAPAQGAPAAAVKPAENFPNQPVELIVPSAAGGGWDRTARTVAKVITDEKLINPAINVVNKAGGGSAVGFNYALEQKGKGHVLSMASTLLFANEALGAVTWTYADFTPLARLTTEHMALAVRAESPLQTANDFVEALKKDPKSLILSAGSAGSSDYVQVGLLAKRSGIDVRQMKIVSFDGGGNAMTALLGANADVMSGQASEMVEQERAGKVRILAISAPKRPTEGNLAKYPTYRDQGIDFDYLHWRGLVLPGGVSADQAAAWDQIVGRMVQTTS